MLHQLNANNLLLGRHFGSSGKWYFAGGQTYMREPAVMTPITGQPTLGLSIYNQYRLLAQYGNLSAKGLSAGVGVAADARSHSVLGATVQANYNWDCCGVAFEYARSAYVPTVSYENSFRFSFSLANVGTFGTIRRICRGCTSWQPSGPQQCLTIKRCLW